MEEEVAVILEEVLTSKEGYYYGSGTFEYKGMRNWKHSEDGVTIDINGLSKKEIEAIEEALMGDSFTGYSPDDVGEMVHVTIYLGDD